MLSWQTERSIHPKSIILFSILAVLATIYFLIIVLPLFDTYFIGDDIFTLDDSPPVREHPFSFLSVTFMDIWWRPLMFGITTYFYLLVGLNPVAFHWFGLLLHLGASWALFLFIKRLFSFRVALIAYIIYMASPIMIGSIGFVTDMIEDELAAVFVFLSLAFAIPGPKRKSLRRPHYLSALFIVCAALCKESALGVLPAVFFLDWVNYSGDKFGKRIIRLLPYALLLFLLPLRFIFVGFYAFYTSSTSVFGANFSFLNILWTTILAFFPIILQSSQVTLNLFLGLVPVLFVTAAIWLASDRRNMVVFLLVALVGAISVLSSIALYHSYGAQKMWMFQWIRMPSLVGIAAGIIAFVAEEIIALNKTVFATTVVTICIVGTYGVLSNSVVRAESDELRQMSEENIAKHRSLIELLRAFPDNSKVFILQRKLYPMNIVNDAVRDKGIVATVLVKTDSSLVLLHNPDPLNKFTKLVLSEEDLAYFRKTYQIKPGTYLVFQTAEEYVDYVKSLTRDPAIRLVKVDENMIWRDVTDNFKD